jgi:AraC family transcriptional regulator of adaptative response / DNA-3-methyladenine glycosylase II
MAAVQPTALDRDACYRALRTRDARFDGHFYTAVVSTGIYCRPVCPARTPKLENCLFLPSAGAAHQMGFRPCLRCRPELAPGVAGWRGTVNTVSRALSLIGQGGFDDGGVEALAERLGVGARQLRRLFDRHVGASPVSVLQAQRILFANKLIAETSLSMTEIALAAGFGSVRRFNDVFQRAYGRPPSALRRASAARVEAGPSVTLKLPFSPPYDWRGMLEFLAARAIPGVELVERERYCRTFALGSATGTVDVRAVPGEQHLLATICTSDVAALGGIVVRLRNVFDLDADSAAIDAHLARQSSLAARVRARAGVRVPGAWDGFEIAVRAVLGQQISVKAATTFAGRLVATLGRALDGVGGALAPRLLFPTPEVVAHADLTGIGLTRARAATLNALGAAVAEDVSLLRSSATLDETVDKLSRLPGVGPWTAQYIAMRALREPDAFPASDLGLMRAMESSRGRPSAAALTRVAEAWRPWRAYAVLRLWTQQAEPGA